jgi:hypothetical protein
VHSVWRSGRIYIRQDNGVLRVDTHSKHVAKRIVEFALLIAGFSLGASLALSLQEHTHPAPQKPSTYCACTTKELWI